MKDDQDLAALKQKFQVATVLKLRIITNDPAKTPAAVAGQGDNQLAHSASTPGNTQINSRHGNASL